MGSSWLATKVEPNCLAQDRGEDEEEGEEKCLPARTGPDVAIRAQPSPSAH